MTAIVSTIFTTAATAAPMAIGRDCRVVTSTCEVAPLAATGSAARPTTKTTATRLAGSYEAGANTRSRTGAETVIPIRAQPTSQ